MKNIHRREFTDIIKPVLDMLEQLEQEEARREVREQVREEVREECRAEGRQEGREHLQNILFSLTKNKFGNLIIRYKEMIEKATAEQLMTWTLKILTAQTPEALFQDELTALKM
jgi:flagellar biosynthesis/type III secretory pathway protein FliH